jgi:excisionase family DNA binding protein
LQYTKNFYRIDEVAQRLDVCKTTIRWAIRRGALPAIRIGGSLRISKETLEALENRTYQGKALPEKTPPGIS